MTIIPSQSRANHRLKSTCLTVTDVLITHCHSLTAISTAHQVCSKYLDLEPKLIKCHLCNYLMWLPIPKWANMTRVEKSSLQWGRSRRSSLLMNYTSQLPSFMGCVCEELSNNLTKIISVYLLQAGCEASCFLKSWMLYSISTDI